MNGASRYLGGLYISYQNIEWFGMGPSEIAFAGAGCVPPAVLVMIQLRDEVVDDGFRVGI